MPETTGDILHSSLRLILRALRREVTACYFSDFCGSLSPLSFIAKGVYLDIGVTDATVAEGENEAGVQFSWAYDERRVGNAHLTVFVIVTITSVIYHYADKCTRIRILKLRRQLTSTRYVPQSFVISNNVRASENRVKVSSLSFLGFSKSRY